MARDKQHNLFQPEDFPDPLPVWEVADLSDVVCAEVVFNLPVDQPFLYLIPDDIRGHVQPGQRVQAGGLRSTSSAGTAQTPVASSVGFCNRKDVQS